jgi:hypothetical protein
MKQSLRVAAIIAGTVLLGACASIQSQHGGASAPAEVRIVNAASYRVVGGGPLVLYTRERNVLSGKRFTVTVDRFFSTSPASSIQPLTLEALKQAYPTNHRFHDLLTLAFRSDAELVRYDAHHNEYLVSRLFRQSLTTGTASSAAQ